MKKIILLSLIVIVAACGNQENDFPDFDYTGVYFPIQFPVRTLILGEDRFDNSLDKELKFHIGAIIAGMYKNTKTWTIDYVIDEDLTEDLYAPPFDRVLPLPTEYYTLNPVNTITISPGSVKGLIQVQLTDAFLDDPLSLTGYYVIPLRMTSTDADIIVTGVPLVDDPDKRVSLHWEPGNQPKDFVLFGIKYINPYHGFYLHRGKDVTYDQNNQIVNEVVYSQPYVERDQIWNLITSGRNEVITNGIGINTGGKNKMKLVFQDNGDVLVEAIPGASFMVNGTGKYVIDGGEWGGMKYNAIFIEYYYNEGANNHVVNDTLVFRNNGVKYQENSVFVFKM